MPGVITIPNWEKYQTYKDSRPLRFVQMHLTLDDDFGFVNLPDLAKAHLLGLWRLAGKTARRASDDGSPEIPDSAAFIAHRISADSTEVVEASLAILADAGFIVRTPSVPSRTNSYDGCTVSYGPSRERRGAFARALGSEAKRSAPTELKGPTDPREADATRARERVDSSSIQNTTEPTGEPVATLPPSSGPPSAHPSMAGAAGDNPVGLAPGTVACTPDQRGLATDPGERPGPAIPPPAPGTERARQEIPLPDPWGSMPAEYRPAAERWLDARQAAVGVGACNVGTLQVGLRAMLAGGGERPSVDVWDASIGAHIERGVDQSAPLPYLGAILQDPPRPKPWGERTGMDGRPGPTRGVRQYEGGIVRNDDPAPEPEADPVDGEVERRMDEEYGEDWINRDDVGELMGREDELRAEVRAELAEGAA